MKRAAEHMFCSGYRRGCRRRRGWRRYRCSGRCGRKLRLGFVVILRKRIIRKRWRLMRRCRHDRRQWRRWLRCRYGRLWRRCWYRRLWLGWLRFRLRRGLFCSYSNNFIYSSSCFCCCVRYIAQLTRSSIDCMCFFDNCHTVFARGDHFGFPLFEGRIIYARCFILQYGLRLLDISNFHYTVLSSRNSV